MLQRTWKRSVAVGHMEENPPTGKRDQMARQVRSQQGSFVLSALLVYQHNTKKITTLSNRAGLYQMIHKRLLLIFYLSITFSIDTVMSVDLLLHNCLWLKCLDKNTFISWWMGCLVSPLLAWVPNTVKTSNLNKAKGRITRPMTALNDTKVKSRFIALVWWNSHYFTYKMIHWKLYLRLFLRQPIHAVVNRSILNIISYPLSAVTPPLSKRNTVEWKSRSKTRSEPKNELIATDKEWHIAINPLTH